VCVGFVRDGLCVIEVDIAGRAAAAQLANAAPFSTARIWYVGEVWEVPLRSRNGA
jgi:hypothetical protein